MSDSGRTVFSPLLVFAPGTGIIKRVLFAFVLLSSSLLTLSLLGLSGFGCARNQAPTEPVLIELTRVHHEQEVGAVVTELVVPDVGKIKQLSRIELLISRIDQEGPDEATFAVMLNLSDQVDPIPPGNFGVIVDPASDDRSIKNVSSAAGLPGRWDQDAPRGSLLKQSVSGVINGNLGVSVWIVPKGWEHGRYAIKTRAVTQKREREPWQLRAEFSYAGEGSIKILQGETVQNTYLVKPVFIDVSTQAIMPFERVLSVTLIRYEQQPQDEGVAVKRWAGDTSGQYKYVEQEQTELRLNELQGGVIPLEPGIYVLQHNSVNGKPPSGFYGKSSFFEMGAEDEMAEIQIPLYPAI